MSEHPDIYHPTNADIDAVIEEASGKPVKPADLTSGIASMRQRITQLEAEKIKLLNQMDEGAGVSLNDHLAVVNKNLAAARDQLADHENQRGKQN